MNKAICLPHKEPIDRLIRYYTRQMEILGVDLYLDKEVSPAFIREKAPHIIIFALGAEPVRMGIPGANLEKVLLAEDVLMDPSSIGESIIIIGGGLLGVELAEALAVQGKEVSLVEQMESVAQDAGVIVKKELIKSLCHLGVKIFVDTKVLAITHEGVTVDRFGEQESLKGVSVVLAVGYRPRKDLIQDLDIQDMAFQQVGDMVKARTIMEAIQEGYRVGMMI